MKNNQILWKKSSPCNDSFLKELECVEPNSVEKSSQYNDLKIAAKIFMILSCVLSAFCFLIPLA